MKRTPLKRTPFKKKDVPYKLESRKPLKRNKSKGLSSHSGKETANDEWNRIKREIKPIFEEFGLYDICELRLEGCIEHIRDIELQFAHSKKRGQIAKHEPERTKELKEVIRVCSSCHYKIEYPKKTEEETSRQIMYRLVLECIDKRNRELQIKSIYY